MAASLVKRQPLSMLSPVLFAISALCWLPCHSQSHQFAAGFRMYKLYDSARRYKPTASPSDKLFFRPVEIDVWYPAMSSDSDSLIYFKDLVELLELRAEFFDDQRDFSGISDELFQHMCAFTDCTDYKILKSIRTESNADAKPAQGQFPLVIYFASLNGMSYENYALFESLAKNGFIVAAISSIGRYPGDMSMDMEDLMEQICDAKFVLEYLRNCELINDRISLVGYSWGGLASTIWSMLEPEKFRAIVTLDGSERLHYYGNEDDKKINSIRMSEVFRPESIKASFLQLSSDPEMSESMPDSVYDIRKTLTTDYNHLRIMNSSHEDFSVYSIHTNAASKRKYEIIKALTVGFLSDKLYSTNTFGDIISKTHEVSSFPYSPSNTVVRAGQKSLMGIVRDRKTNLALPYVNIGIVDKDVGTTTDINGKFELKLSGSNVGDQLKISTVGYQAREIDISDVLDKMSPPIILHLEEKVTTLEEVVVISEKPIQKTLGNKSLSKFFGAKFASDDLGSEFAIRINLRKKTALLDKLQFNISYNDVDSFNDVDSSSFRFNIYSVKDGLPFENIVPDNIIVRIGKQTGKIEVDVSKYNIVLKDDCFIGLEWVEGKSNSEIVFSAGFGSKTFFRKASQGRWRKYPMGVGINIEVKY